ncbi:hypothetical protein Tco_0441222 [Tanacetum coccineum]
MLYSDMFNCDRILRIQALDHNYHSLLIEEDTTRTIAKPILKKYMKNAQAKSNPTEPIFDDDMNIELSKEFLIELKNNAYHGMFDEDVVDHIAKGEGKITTWEELVEIFFCKFYPESHDGEDEMLDEGDNWGIDPLEFISRVNSSFENHMKVDGRTKKVLFHSWMNGTHDERDIKEGNELRQMKRKGDNKNDGQPNKRVCKAEKFEAIKYSLGPNEEYIAVRRCEYNTWERNEDRLRCKEIDDVGEVSTIWKSRSVGVLESQDGCSTHILIVNRRIGSGSKHFKTLSLDESRLLDFDLFSDLEEYSKEEVTETMAETMEQYMSKTRADYRSGVARPKIKENDNFKLKGQFIKELRTNTFSGSDHEDANEHIEKVLEIVDLFHIPNITIDQVMLRAFPMSLTGAVSRWLRNKPSGSITTWEDLKTKFLSKYCPPARTAKKMEEINNFQQEPDENLYQAWERFKELLMKCPQHYLTKMQEVVLFYNGLDVPTRQILDSRGAIPSKNVAAAKVAIQEMAEYSQKWHNVTSRTKSNETFDGLAAI